MKKFLFFVCALVAACVMSSCSGNEDVKVDSGSSYYISLG
jgi:hypothetical protein